MEIPLALLESYLFAIDHFPDVTPNRWMFVSELLDKSRTSACYEASVAVVVGTSIGCPPKLFGGTAKDCRDLFDIITSQTGSRTTPEVYHANHYQRNAVQLQHLSEFARTDRDQWTPTPMRIEEAWFLWRIICTYAEFPQLQTSNLYTEYSTHGKRRDLESLCEDLWNQICSRQNTWVMH